MSRDPRNRIVEVLEDAGTPLERGELADRADLDEAEFESALAGLRGQQVVRYVSDRDAYRLTYWPEQSDCAVCGGDIAGEEYYELELRPQATNTESTVSGSLHTTCALDLLDDLSLEGTDAPQT